MARPALGPEPYRPQWLVPLTLARSFASMARPAVGPGAASASMARPAHSGPEP